MTAPAHFLPSPAVPRRAVHQRSIQLHAFARDDGLWDLEALIEDVKSEPFATPLVNFACGVPVHLMALRFTVNGALDILEAQAMLHRAPFPGLCAEVQSRIQRLQGCNLLKGFRRVLADRLPAHERCTHLSELAALMPTLAVQTLLQGQSGTRGATPHQQDAAQPTPSSAQRPLKIDGCHAWRADGELVRLHYPQWHITRRPENPGDNDNRRPA